MGNMTPNQSTITLELESFQRVGHLPHAPLCRSGGNGFSSRLQIQTCNGSVDGFLENFARPPTDLYHGRTGSLGSNVQGGTGNFGGSTHEIKGNVPTRRSDRQYPLPLGFFNIQNSFSNFFDVVPGIDETAIYDFYWREWMEHKRTSQQAVENATTASNHQTPCVYCIETYIFSRFVAESKSFFRFSRRTGARVCSYTLILIMYVSCSFQSMVTGAPVVVGVKRSFHE